MLLRRVVDAILYLRWMDEASPEMRDVLKELCFQAQPDMVEENQVLVYLSHVPYVRYYRQIEDLREEADGQKFADSRDSCAIDLDER